MAWNRNSIYKKRTPDRFVKYFEKHKNEAIKFKLTKFAWERASLKGSYWQNLIKWKNHLVKEEIRSRNKSEKTASLIDAIEAMKEQYLRMCKDVCKAIHGERPYIVTTVQTIYKRIAGIKRNVKTGKTRSFEIFFELYSLWSWSLHLLDTNFRRKSV